ncbi:tetratricopeptide repeat protein [Romeria aff. gracilis LEGE 07310]|uniref:Tetratricopeptide repeat protein n=1 Tax=Vasconcelosia minhoensis LEGE 07310 TaxID=915328 RepID=A0A8J7AYG5_9CYAN|nr:tetratricopeptide repeat protein [Romeria gracilis]MBE9080118.1 tetratricopeptide repeat protein [Romeria aff. gracilis LEGE 07310]
MLRLTATGSNSAEMGELAEAELELQRAIGLDPDNANAHYQLGQVYSQIQHPEEALAQYQIAAQQGNPNAAAALAGLYVEQGNDAQAAAQAIHTLAELPETAETRSLRYQLYLHLGEARLNQGRFNQALESLQIAARLAQELAQSDANSGQATAPAAAPFCLLAETLEQQQQRQAARSFWQRCLNYANQSDPEEDRWIGTAMEQLEGE